MPAEPSACLIRHGETEFSAARRYNGVTDAPLTPHGEDVAARLQPVLTGGGWELVLCSPLHRARRTAELAGFPDPEIVAELRECDYGQIEGLTTEEISQRWPGWDFWRDGCPGGESADDVATRVAPVVARLRKRPGRALVFSHSHTLRILTARWLDLHAEQAAIFALEPARIGEVGTHRGRPILVRWNDEASETATEEVT
jgi:broad specificity phosphatase PhoE